MRDDESGSASVCSVHQVLIAHHSWSVCSIFAAAIANMKCMIRPALVSLWRCKKIRLVALHKCKAYVYTFSSTQSASKMFHLLFYYYTTTIRIIFHFKFTYVAVTFVFPKFPSFFLNFLDILLNFLKILQVFCVSCPISYSPSPPLFLHANLVSPWSSNYFQ